ncbi:MFS transporter [Peterkaempfera sp. SMS 1(5)a]
MLYPVYAILFADHGLSDAQISSLFAIWSATAVLLEIPTGLWADSVSRRLLLTIAPLPVAAAWALWTLTPCYLSFALGFVLWGVAGSLRSGTLQALVYEELAALDSTADYARLIGRSQAASTTAATVATALAAPVLAVGGFPAVGLASIAATLLAVPVALTLPETRARPARRRGDAAGVLRDGLAQLRRGPVLRHRLLVLSVLLGMSALDEYVPLLADATGAGAVAVPLLVLVVSCGTAAGGWLAGRGMRWTAPVLAVAAGCLALGAASGEPAGLVLVAVAFGVLQWAQAAAEARLQDTVEDSARATVTSVAGSGSEVVSVLLYGGWALGSAAVGPGPLMALAAAPCLGLAWALRRRD